MLKDKGNKSFWKDIRRWWCFHPSKIFPNCWQIEVFLDDGNFVVFISSWRGNALDGFDFFFLSITSWFFKGKSQKPCTTLKRKLWIKNIWCRWKEGKLCVLWNFSDTIPLISLLEKKSDWTRFSWQTRLKSNSILVKIDSDVLVMRYLPTNQADLCLLHLWPPLGKM